MDFSRWKQIEDLYHAALDRETGERPGFLGEACAGDADLRHEVESLLAQQSSKQNALDRPAWEGALGFSSAYPTVTVLAPGTRLGPYKIEGLLGKGGMGEVFRAVDTRLRRSVAIKILPRDNVADPKRKRRFLQEARAVSSLNHTNIVTLHDIANDGDTDYLVMEYAPGESLDRLIAAKELPISEALGYAEQIASALAAAHTVGVVHRDLKPANIKVTPQGVVKVLDFGLAKLFLAKDHPEDSTQTLTAAGTVMGTPPYMSPEQALGKTADARSDIFSFGVVLYEMLCGRRPFRGANTVEILDQVLHSAPDAPRSVRPDIPPKVENVILRCLEKTAAARYASVAEIQAELNRQLRSNPSSFPWKMVAASLGLTLALSLGYFVWHPHASQLGSNDAVTPSANAEANDQYELAINFLAVQNDIPMARKAFEHALELDPHFASARLQHATMTVIEIFNGYTNDRRVLYQAEEELHQAEQTLPGSDVLVLSTQAAVYLAQGRLDRIPLAKLEEQWRKGGNPTWLVIIRMLQGQNDELLAILRKRLERMPLENPSRMFLGELLRTQGDTVGAIQTLQRALQQAPNNITAAWFLTMAYLDGGKPEQARALLEGLRPGFEKNYMWRHAWAILLAAEGKPTEALQAMDEGTLKFAQLTWTVTSTTADFYALLGDHAKAIEWLQLAVARGDERVGYFRRNPRLASLRNDTSFQSMLTSVEARRRR